jgi:hypothetical protein
VSKGDEKLLELGEYQCAHFPQGEAGEYDGFYPADSAQGIAHLEMLRRAGTEFLLFPKTAFWWLDHYTDFGKHLETSYPLIARDEDACLIFSLIRRRPAVAHKITANPKISVCIPTYNRARYLGEALESVLDQTLQDFEIIVYDDASTDKTRTLVAGIGDPRVRYFRQPHNVGIPRNRNSCLKVARGRYIAWLDSDDIYYPETLALQNAVLDRHANVGMVHGAFHIIDAEGRRTSDWELPFDQDMILSGDQTLRELILNNYVTTSTVMVRRSCQENLGCYATDLRVSEDWEMWLRFALQADVAYTSEP